MYTKHCVKCKKLMKDEEIICPHCGAIQPVETEETKKNAERKKESKFMWIVFVIVAIITMCIPLGSFWARLIMGVVFGYIAVLVAFAAIEYTNDKDKK